MIVPNATVRLGITQDHRKTVEPDLLVLHDGKLGVLEVDGETWHPPSRASEEHERDRLFKDHGIRVVERFDAKDCYELPDDTAIRFLRLLSLNG